MISTKTAAGLVAGGASYGGNMQTGNCIMMLSRKFVKGILWDPQDVLEVGTDISEHDADIFICRKIAVETKAKPGRHAKEDPAPTETKTGKK
jgi:hypothetical protein